MFAKLYTFAFALLAFANVAFSENRFALVIGNAEYEHAPILKNPASDAKAVSDLLTRAGFTVHVAIDTSKQEFEKIFRKYLGEIKSADVALFYYAGHAVQVNGINYLVPVDARLESAIDLDMDAFSLDHMQAYFERMAKVRLIFLDACRDNPFQGREYEDTVSETRSLAGEGLAAMNANSGTLISFSTAPGDVAQDGAGRLSPFATSFVAHALTPGLELRRLLTMVRSDVSEKTAGRQTPWENSALFGDFYFVDPKPSPIVAELHQASVPANSNEVPLNIPRPVQPAGGDLTITLSSVPEIGDVELDGRKLVAGANLTANETERLGFRPNATAAGKAGFLEYLVSDEFNNQKRALVAIMVTEDGVPSDDGPSEKRANERDSFVAALKESLRFPRQVNLGVGPVQLQLAATQVGPSNEYLVIRDVPEDGILYLGGETIGEGELISLKDVSNLAFRPSVDASLGRRKIVSELQNSDSGPIEIDVEVEANACDETAGEPLDLQAIGAGRLANEIKIEEGHESCLAAIIDYPTVGRFYYQLARVEIAKGNVQQASELLRAAIERGHIRAHYTLGQLFSRGAFGQIKSVEAIAEFERGTEKGDPFSMHALGRRLFLGNGTEKDEKRGLALMLQAAEMGHTFSMNELGRIFRQGQGVKRDISRTVAFYKSSAEREDIYGLNNLGVLYLNGDGVVQDYQKALELFIRATNSGHPYSATNIGRMYYQGVGVTKDIPQAALWYGISADRGDGYAANNLGWILSHGEAGTTDLIKAAKYYALAAAFGQKDPGDKAREALAEISDENKKSAILLLLTEIYGEKLNANSNNPIDGIASEDLAKAGLETPSTLEEELIAVAKLKWLRSKPRFDLF